MSDYVIHACEARMWYVENYLVPSMKDQGITNISVRCDTEHLGNLESCMQIFMKMYGDGGAWHMQDDVIICRNFKEITEQYTDGIVCGFDYVLDRPNNVGYVKPGDMWYSFPCIHIPNHIARECARWFYTKARYNSKYAEWVKTNKFDDCVLEEFLKIHYPDMDVLNLKPNLVDHIDFLIGGSIINKIRKAKQSRANYFEDQDLVYELQQTLKNRGRVVHEE